MNSLQKSHLKRNLENRHIQFIALGGAVGTGLFLGAGSAIFVAGPSVLLGYLIVGIIVFLIMRQLGEMNTQDPSAGSSSYFAYKYWGEFPSFLAGWNYWIGYALAGITELIAVAAYTQYWFPNLATWKTALFFFVIINLINLATVKAYGEIEFWLSSIKIFAICAMILAGGYILFFDPNLVPGASIKNLWQPATVGPHAGNSLFGGFLPHGLMGLITALPMITFAFGGLELIGVTAAETADPSKTIPKAINQVVFRILIFYVGSLAALLSLYHWSNLSIFDSPFVMIFDKIGFKYAAWALNFIVLTAGLSVYSSCIYSNSRMLYGLALQNNAPQALAKIDKRGIPFTATLLSSAITFLVVPLNYFVPNWFEALKIIISFAVMCILVNWGMITLSHLKFKQKNPKTLFPAPFYPYSGYITLVFIIFILVIMVLPQIGMAKQVIALPVWILTVYTFYRFLRVRKAK
ncbi:MAG: amino acid permease [Endomicrobium sp.]|jgi:L-asparagine transporter-like permease|nr:amino acid permease [Endomicrobium sp.]